MERIIKLFLATLLILPLSFQPIKAENLTFSENISYENCTKIFNIDNINLFYLTISSINSNKFTLNEIQSKSGYILFTAFGRKYLASIINVNTNQSMLKITPTDNNYKFQKGILTGVFNYITTNETLRPKNIFTNQI